MRRVFGVTLFTIAIVISSPSWAYYTLQDTGDMLKPNQMRLGAEAEFVTHGDDGLDVTGKFDYGVRDDLGLRVEAGTGATDILVGGYVKWVPIPDYQNQPAIGVVVGGHYAHYHAESETALRITPFASKNFATDIGPLTPYAGLAIAMAEYNGDSFTPIQLVLGCKAHFEEVKGVDFTAELDFDVNQAPNAITVGALFPLPE